MGRDLDDFRPDLFGAPNESVAITGSLAVPSMTIWRHDGVQQNWQDPLVAQRSSLDGSRAYRNQIDHFLEVVAGDAQPVVTARDAMMTLAATLAVEIAAREDRTVTLQEILAT